MALARCADCGHEVSSSAKTCPGCGKPNPGLTRAQRAGGWIFLGLVVLALGAWLSPSTKREPPPSPPAPPAAQAAPPRLPSEEAKKKQPQRKAAVERFVGRGILHGYLDPDESHKWMVFRIGPAWRNLPLEEKRVVVDVAFTYHWVEHPSLESVLLEDWRTGKSVGSFSPQWGLRLDD